MRKHRVPSSMAGVITSQWFYSWMKVYWTDGTVARRRLFLFGNHYQRAMDYQNEWLAKNEGRSRGR